MEWNYVAVNSAVYAKLSKEMNLEKVNIDPEVEDAESGIRAVFHAPKVEQIFFHGGENPRGLMGSILVYPSDDYDFPGFAYDWGMMVIPHMYIFTLVDLHPLRKDEAYTRKYIAPLKQIYDKYVDFHQFKKESRVKWSEPFHSSYDYRGRIPPENVTDSINMIVDYLDLWLQFWREAKPQNDPQLRAEAEAHLTDMRENMRARDPGRGPHIKKFGKEKTERLMDLCF